MSRTLPVKIRGTGSYVPDDVLTNDFFASYLDTSDEWIYPRTGIKKRHRVAPGQGTLHLCKHASLRAIEDAGLEPKDIDLILVATITPERTLPSTACFLQAELGLENIPAFDLTAACSGFVYGMITAGSLMAAAGYRNVLLVGGETLTSVTDYQDRSTCILFGDAAGAAVLEYTGDQEPGILYHTMGAMGREAEAVWIPAGGSAMPASEQTVKDRQHYMQMKGGDLFKMAVGKLIELVNEALEATGYSADDLAMLVPHQSNKRIMEATRKRLKLPPEKLGMNIEEYGNTSAASIPLLLDQARKDGRLKEGDLIMLLGFGGGVTWGLTMLRL